MNNDKRTWWQDTKLLFRSVPTVVVTLFAVSVVAMNLLANKTIYQSDLLAIDGGILLSWLSWLCMDIITKHFGPRASIKLSIFAILVNLFVCVIFFVVSIIPTAEDYSAFNTIIGGTWFIVLSSTVAFVLSALVNAFLNFGVGRLFKDKNKPRLEYFSRVYVSTFIGQFVDNLTFAVMTFMIFAPIFWDGFHWTFLQCLTCSLLGAVLELVAEAIFSPIGYKIVQRWQRENIGEEYLKGKEV